jgi:hypothetical protein
MSAKRQKIQKEDDDLDIDDIFHILEEKRKEVLNADKGKHTYKQNDPTASDFWSEVEEMELYTHKNLKPWEKISATMKEHLLKEPNVDKTSMIMTGILNVPIDKRRMVTPRFFLLKQKHRGYFYELQKAKIITQKRTSDNYLLCSTMSRRIDENSILTGNYLFKLIEEPTREDGTKKEIPQAETIFKSQVDVMQVFLKNATFYNFYFEVIEHGSAEPSEDLYI